MPDIKPFRGILFDNHRVNLTDVVAPPYDVISPELQTSLYRRHPNNVVRLILNNEANPYIAAGREFRAWRDDAILVQDELPAVYILAQSFRDSHGNAAERWGFIAACWLEDFGKGSITPHEKTLSGPREDRFRLFQATNAMFSQIFSLYSDPQHALDEATHSVASQQPHTDVTFEGVRNRLWRLTDARHRAAISEYLKGQKVLIADGHHRYETALVYRDSMRMKNPDHTGKEPYNFVPMFFTNMHDPGLAIYPTHRLVHSLPGYRRTVLLNGCKPYFKISEHSTVDDLLGQLESSRKGAFGLALSEPNRLVLLRSREEAVRAAADGIPASLADLDVTILHTIILKKVLGMDDDAQEKKYYLLYEKDARRAIDAVNEGAAQAAFIMNPTRIEQVRAVAAAGMVMPQKSTFFYPKLLSGMVIYAFEEVG